MTDEELERYQRERRWRDYRPSLEERRLSPCKWGIALERDGCLVRGCPRHDPASSWYWVNVAEAREKVAGSDGFAAESRFLDGKWQTLVLGRAVYIGDSEYQSQCLANGAVKCSPRGGVLTYHDKHGLVTGVHWLDPDPEDDFYAGRYRAHLGIELPPAETRLRLSPLASRSGHDLLERA